MTFVVGCHQSDSLTDGTAGTVWGPPHLCEMLNEFAGTWALSSALTREASESSSTNTLFEPVDGYQIMISGHIANGVDVTGEQYRMFSLHRHDGWVCGRAWHHEDRLDPGDMSKCHVRLKRDGDKLIFRVRCSRSGGDANDLDVGHAIPVILADNSPCPLDHDFEYVWDDWETRVYLPTLHKHGK
ncbi:MAG: hypothetical protein FJ267_08500 [Planctomycetes bacterium]|nr:hypothetical protein [Planctomycetota bacterium]